MTPDEFVAFLGESRASAILRTGSRGAAEAAMEAAVRGGFRVIEFTLTTPGALDLIADFAGRPGLVVGAGTVLTPDEARSATAAGSRFLVSPVVDEAVIEEGRRLGLAVMPGAHTPTELMRAHRGGAPLQKLFPAPASVPQFIGSVLGPLPFLRIVPTNGVDANNAAACLEAGAFAVGFTTALFDADDIAQHRFERIEERARGLLAALGTRPPAGTLIAGTPGAQRDGTGRTP